MPIESFFLGNSDRGSACAGGAAGQTAAGASNQRLQARSFVEGVEMGQRATAQDVA